MTMQPKERFHTVNHPNPFNPSTTIMYSLNDDSYVTVEIYNIQGRRIKTLTNEFKTKGTHSVLWNGDNNAGVAVSSGIYYYKINVEGQDMKRHSVVKRMLLMK